MQPLILNVLNDQFFNVCVCVRACVHACVRVNLFHKLVIGITETCHISLANDCHTNDISQHNLPD